MTVLFSKGSGYIFAARRYASAVWRCLSVTSRCYCIKTAKHITQTTPYASPGLHFFGPEEFLYSIGSLQTAESKHTTDTSKNAIFLK